MFNEITWKEGEKQTQKYMIEHGYKILYTNFQCAGVELDIVSILPAKVQDKVFKSEIKKRIKSAQTSKMKRFFKQNYKKMRKNLHDLLVITEVKARANSNFGTGLEAVDSNKVYRMKKGADYLLQKREFKDYQVRFDISSVDGGEINYIENAFK